MKLLIGGEKGGTGKTTIATNIIAMRRIKEDKEALLVDADKQGTASYWCSLRDEDKITPRIPSIQKFGANIKNDLRELSTKYEDIVVDAGGHDSKELRSSLLVVDQVVFPVRASQFDLWTLSKLNNLVDDARITNEQLKGFILINAASTHPSVDEHAEVLEYMEEMDNLMLLDTVIRERKVLRRCAMTGMCAIEYPQQDEKAIQEMNDLYKEIYNNE